ncbi:MAG: MoaD/ThiS family protein [Nitrososphaerota archaeon]|jgi:molybdopterin converting factor small subunit|nr:MoaD/ThiS family protein [Nitrososphaerota archaeon]MDG6978890.1 MoaD/ThiS family protein [Nitrososphaerota archaeon]MDG7020438.1 MoaD/ThiS family protein [Nitrososphaerota archaeon]MDG7021771.1 MoaD/ThiS family protein [Nitrososphaerota archaeon]
MALSVHIAGHLKDYTGASVEMELAEASDVMDVIRQLDAKVPGIKDRILDEHDRTRPYVNIFVNEVSIRDLQGESTRTQDGAVIYILPSVAGGMTFSGGEAP